MRWLLLGLSLAGAMGGCRVATTKVETITEVETITDCSSVYVQATSPDNLVQTLSQVSPVLAVPIAHPELCKAVHLLRIDMNGETIFVLDEPTEGTP